MILVAGCAMRWKYRKQKPWAEAHHLQRQVAYLKQGPPIEQREAAPTDAGKKLTSLPESDYL